MKHSIPNKDYLKLKLELMNISDNDLAYFAGLFDGEGNLDFRVVDKGSSHCVSSGMSVTNTCMNVLKWCKNKFGGDIYKHFTVNKYSVFNWQLRKRAELLWLVPSIYPYLIIKKPEADIYLKGISLIRTHLGTRKGTDRSNATICHPIEYWNELIAIEKELKHSKHEYKQLS